MATARWETIGKGDNEKISDAMCLLTFSRWLRENTTSLPIDEGTRFIRPQARDVSSNCNSVAVLQQ